jgi:hypothetical protein
MIRHDDRNIEFVFLAMIMAARRKRDIAPSSATPSEIS